jgi:hypothetical protein
MIREMEISLTDDDADAPLAPLFVEMLVLLGRETPELLVVAPCAQTLLFLFY